MPAKWSSGCAIGILCRSGDMQDVLRGQRCAGYDGTCRCQVRMRLTYRSPLTGRDADSAESVSRSVDSSTESLLRIFNVLWNVEAAAAWSAKDYLIPSLLYALTYLCCVRDAV